LVFSQVSFELQDGALLELRGANGAGKSSLLRLVAGLVEPLEGTLNCEPEECHYIGHADGHKPVLTVLENLEFWAGFLGGKIQDNVLQHFNLQNLAHDPAALLSEGQKRRLALTRLVLAYRRIWLLDEPMVGLDATSQEQLRGVMKKHLAEQGMIIASTHTELGLSAAQTLTLGGA
jgi:heme exporter protein A